MFHCIGLDPDSRASRSMFDIDVFGDLRPSRESSGEKRFKKDTYRPYDPPRSAAYASSRALRLRKELSPEDVVRDVMLWCESECILLESDRRLADIDVDEDWKTDWGLKARSEEEIVYTRSDIADSLSRGDGGAENFFTFRLYPLICGEEYSGAGWSQLPYNRRGIHQRVRV